MEQKSNISNILKALAIGVSLALCLTGLIAMAANDNTKNSSTTNNAPVPVVTTQNDNETVTTTRTVTKTEPVAYDKQTFNDPNVDTGKTYIKQAGRNGTRTITYEVTYEDGKEINRVEKSNEITEQPVAEITGIGTKVVWSCVDATSYDKNPYNDNKCTSSNGEVRYVSDSQSRALDPDCTPGKSGHPWYNSK